jgi:hypothetical protein
MFLLLTILTHSEIQAFDIPNAQTQSYMTQTNQFPTLANLSNLINETKNAILKLDGRINETQNAILKLSNETKNAILKLDGRINETQNAILKLSNETQNSLLKLDGRINETQNAILKLSNETQNSILKLDGRINSTNDKIDSVQNDIKFIKKDLISVRGKNAIKNSYNSGGLIIIEGEVKDLYFGSGNLIQFDGKLYFCTCLHNIYNESIKQTKTIGQIYLHDNTKLEVTGKVIVYRAILNDPTYNCEENSTYDYALIKIKKDQNYFSNAVNLSNTTLKLANKIRGTITYYGGEIYTEGIVKEIGPSRNSFFTNTAGIPGFSGGGCFNERGQLQAIHRGSGKLNSESSINTVYYNTDNIKPIRSSVKDAIEVCQENVSSPKCIEEILYTLNFASKNYRSEVLDTSYLRELLYPGSTLRRKLKIKYLNKDYDIKGFHKKYTQRIRYGP